MRTFLVFMSALCIAFAVSCSKKAENPDAAVSFFRGDVTRNGSPVSIGDVVSESDTIITAAQSSCDIRLGGSIIRIKEKSTLIFSALALGGAAEKTSLELGQGKLLCKPKKLLKDESFTVKTPTAVAAVRGTEFIVESDANQTTRIKVFDGKVKVAKRVKPLEEKMDAVMEASSAVETKESVIITKKETAEAAMKVEKALAENKDADITAVIAKVQNDVAIAPKDIRAFKVEDFKAESAEIITVKEKEPELVKQITKIIKQEKAEAKPAPEGRLLVTRSEIYFIKNGRVEWEGKVSAAPVKNKGMVYVASEDYIFCASAEGPVLWKKQMINDGKIDVTGDTATIYVKGVPQKFNAETGKERL